MRHPGGISAKTFYVSIITAFFIAFAAMPLWASEPAVRYEYKLLRLGSLSSLQKDDGAGAKHTDVEKELNDAGLEGWELVNVFAVRTTFYPNVFYAVMKRPLPESGGSAAKGDEKQ